MNRRKPLVEAGWRFEGSPAIEAQHDATVINLLDLVGIEGNAISTIEAQHDATVFEIKC